MLKLFLTKNIEMKLYYLITCIMLMSVINFAQLYNDPMKFFPAQTGDMWEYFYYDAPYSDTLQLFSVKDSVDEQGVIHLWQSSGFINPPKPPVLAGSNYYKIDKEGNVEGYWESYRGILFKLKAVQGDKWILKEYSANAFEIIRVDSVFESSLFGMNTVIKKYRRYFSDDSSAITGLDRTAKFLAYNLGLVRVDGLEGLGSLFIKGAVINSVIFGDTTRIITSVFDDETGDYLEEFNISQNYPNPFNPSTKITYNIPQRSNVSLRIYDVLGKEIATLVNEQKEAGTYNIQFDASKLSSGVYIYSIQAGDFLESRKMILMK
ncbi:MAG: T9SS type A sorting domain-containing protein [Ignavibacteriales bacterium]|nr:T9SS type A sorting domain-containing protein [Ignavibacteriales bacterium]